MGYELTGQVWDAEGFRRYCGTLDLSWASGVTIHHTAAPSLAQRPHGLRIQHMRNLEDYYKNKLGWSAGPHLFIDEDQIFGLSSLERPGTHARSFNRTHVGIEVLGDYDSEDPKTGRGFQCWTMAAEAVVALQSIIRDCTVNFHRDDPKTSKTCPGKLVAKDWFLSLVHGRLPLTDEADRQSDFDPAPALASLESIQWQIDKLRKLLI